MQKNNQPNTNAIIIFGIAMTEQPQRNDVELCALSAYFHSLNNPKHYFKERERAIEFFGEKNNSYVDLFKLTIENLAESKKDFHKKTYNFDNTTFTLDTHKRTIEVLGHYIYTNAELRKIKSPAESLEDTLQDIESDMLWIAAAIKDHYKENPKIANDKIKLLNDTYIKISLKFNKLPKVSLSTKQAKSAEEKPTEKCEAKHQQIPMQHTNFSGLDFALTAGVVGLAAICILVFVAILLS